MKPKSPFYQEIALAIFIAHSGLVWSSTSRREDQPVLAAAFAPPAERVANKPHCRAGPTRTPPAPPPIGRLPNRFLIGRPLQLLLGCLLEKSFQVLGPVHHPLAKSDSRNWPPGSGQREKVPRRNPQLIRRFPNRQEKFGEHKETPFSIGFF